VGRRRLREHDAQAWRSLDAAWLPDWISEVTVETEVVKVNGATKVTTEACASVYEMPSLMDGVASPSTPTLAADTLPS
jgi:hypothetical protein